MATAEHIADEGTFVVAGDDLATRDPLGYPGYAELTTRARLASDADESVIAGRADISGHDVELASFEFRFLGGSMGEVAGERLARALERAARRAVPFVLSTASGGARLHEGMRALVQMPKVVCARLELARARQPLLVALGNPTTGGVYATLGGLGDVTVAEAGAMLGFAGPRLVQRFTRRPLAPDSHTAEAALAHGLVDAVVPRAEVRTYLAAAVGVLAADDPAPAPAPPPPPPTAEPDAWEVVRAARSSERLTGHELVSALGDRAIELRGDRAGRDDPGVHAALARIEGRRALVLALDRNHPAGPAGCRKAVRALEVAARLGIPVVTLIDTPGLDPSEDSEAGGIAPTIARLFEAMLSAPVATLAVVTGEGGSGGALAFAAADVVVAYSDSIFSVIGPEGAAQILWRDSDRAPEAARALRLGSEDLVRLGIADGLIPDGTEPLTEALAYHLDRLARTDVQELLAARHDRWRRRV
jgi:acetyl-CoA carboxylase carboxyl transferase subunit beta